MRRKILYVFLFFVFFCFASVGVFYGNLYLKEHRAVAYVAEVEKEFPFTPLPEPADPNHFSPAAQAFVEYVDQKKPFSRPDGATESFAHGTDPETLHTLLTNALSRLPGYLPKMPEMGLCRDFPVAFLVNFFRFYSFACEDAVKTGDKDKFMTLLREFETAKAALPKPISAMEFVIFKGVITPPEIHLGAFPETTIEELQAALNALPTDEMLASAASDVLNNEYRHFFLPLLSHEFEPLIPPKCRNLPKALLYSRVETQAEYLKYIRGVRKSFSFSPAERNAWEASVGEAFEKRRWYQGNVAGLVFVVTVLPGNRLLDGARNHFNLCRLAIASHIFYRRYDRQIDSLDELITSGILPSLPISYSDHHSFSLVEKNGEKQIQAPRRMVFRLIPPNPAAGPLLVDEEDFTCNAD